MNTTIVINKGLNALSKFFFVSLLVQFGSIVQLIMMLFGLSLPFLYTGNNWRMMVLGMELIQLLFFWQGYQLLMQQNSYVAVARRVHQAQIIVLITMFIKVLWYVRTVYAYPGHTEIFLVKYITIICVILVYKKLLELAEVLVLQSENQLLAKKYKRVNSWFICYISITLLGFASYNYLLSSIHYTQLLNLSINLLSAIFLIRFLMLLQRVNKSLSE